MKKISGSSLTAIESGNKPAVYRAIYGFVLWLVSYLLFVVFLIWAYIPDEWLHQLGLTYWPQKYWAVAIPAYIVTGFLMVEFIFYPHLNVLLTPELSDSKIYTDEYACYTPGSGIAPVSDIFLVEVSQMIHM